MKKLTTLILSVVVALLLIPVSGCTPKEEAPIGMAVEFNAHAACASIARDKGWFEAEGLELSAYESYDSGMALAAALARGDIRVAYICLVPAINAYANAGVPIKIAAGIHKYGYGLVVDPARVETVQDLEKPGIRIGCVREGGAVDIVLHKTIDKYHLDEGKILNNTQRMEPSKQVMAIRMGQLDAAFLPEQWATMAEESGFKMLLMSQDIWSNMQGSVLVVKEELIRAHPEIVSKLVKVSRKATDWLNEQPDAAAEVVARQLQLAGSEALSASASELTITPKVLLRSMARLDYTTAVDPAMVQETIDYLARLGYIKSSFAAQNILDLRFIKDE